MLWNTLYHGEEKCFVLNTSCWWPAGELQVKKMVIETSVLSLRSFLTWSRLYLVMVSITGRQCIHKHKIWSCFGCLILNKWVFQQFCCCWTGRWVSLQAKFQKTLSIFRQMIWNFWYIFAISNFKYCSCLLNNIDIIQDYRNYKQQQKHKLRKKRTPSYWLQGGLEVAISRMVHPRLHISTERV